MVIIGYVANKVGWLPIDSSKYLSKIVVNIAAPCVVIYSMSKQALSPDTISVMMLIIGIVSALYIFSWILSIGFVKVLKVDLDDRGVYKNFLIFMNNAFMGFPVAYALYGADGMFLMVLGNIVMVVMLYTLGIHNLHKVQPSEGTKWEIFKQRAKNMINPPVISTIIGLIVFLFQIPIPSVIGDVLDAVGATMSPLCMIVIGLQLTESKPSEVMTNHKLMIMCLFRLIIIPGIVFLPMYLLKVDSLVICIVTLYAMLPCSAVCVALAEEYENNTKLAAEGTFLSTLFSIATIPVIGILLTTYVL